MLQIRHGVFETNSSSSHSISIRKMNEITTPEEIADQFKYRIWPDGSLRYWDHELEFGRSPFEPLTTFADKLRYAIASYGDNEEMIETIKSIMFKYIPNLKKIEFPTTNYNWHDPEDDTERPYYGDIDHQSCGVLQGCLRRHNISLEEFLLNKKYVVFIDGDEYCIKEHLFESGLFHKEDFEEV